MPNFINGSRLKRYEGPLTEDMLEQIHRAKMYKEGQQLLKEKAQLEAKECRQRMRECRHSQVLMVLTSTNAQDEDIEVVPPFLLNTQI